MPLCLWCSLTMKKQQVLQLIAQQRWCQLLQMKKCRTVREGSQVGQLLRCVLWNKGGPLCIKSGLFYSLGGQFQCNILVGFWTNLDSSFEGRQKEFLAIAAICLDIWMSFHNHLYSSQGNLPKSMWGPCCFHTTLLPRNSQSIYLSMILDIHNRPLEYRRGREHRDWWAQPFCSWQRS